VVGGLEDAETVSTRFKALIVGGVLCVFGASDGVEQWLPAVLDATNADGVTATSLVDELAEIVGATVKGIEGSTLAEACEVVEHLVLTFLYLVVDRCS
jgi:hypothetical protein